MRVCCALQFLFVGVALTVEIDRFLQANGLVSKTGSAWSSAVPSSAHLFPRNVMLLSQAGKSTASCVFIQGAYFLWNIKFGHT